MIRFLTSWAAKHLANHRAASERERVKAKARQLCAEMGKPVPSVLR